MSSNELKLTNVLCPSPTAVRGVPLRLDGFQNSIVYGSASAVIVRSLDPNGPRPIVCNLHKHVVTAVRFSPDGKWVASGDQEGTVAIWANQEGTKEKLNTAVLQGPIRDLAFSEDGKTVVACGEGKVTFGIAFSVDGEPYGALQGHTRKIMTADIRSKPSFQVCGGGAELFLSFHEGKPLVPKGNVDPGNENTVTFLRYSPDQKEVVCSSSSPWLLLVDSSTQKATRFIDTKHTGTTYGFAWSADGKRIASCSADKSVHVMDYHTGAVIDTVSFGKDVNEMQQGITAVKDGFVAASLGGTVRLVQGGVKQTLVGHQARVPFLHVTGNGKVVSLSVDGRLLTWDKMGEKGVSTPVPTLSDVASAAAVHNGVVYIAAGKKLIAYDTNASEQVTEVSKDINFPNAIAVTSEKVIVVLYRSKAHIPDTKTEVQLPRFEGTCADASGTVVVLGGDNEAKLYETKGGTLTSLINIPHSTSVSAVSLSKDGSRLATGDNARNVNVWDAKTGAAIYSQLTFHTLSVTKVCFDPSGKFLLSGSSDCSLILWDLEKDGRKIQDNAHKGGVNSVAWGPQGQLLSSGSDFCIKVWSA